MSTSFLQQVTSDLIARVGIHALDRYTLVFPMQRAGLFVRKYIADHIRSLDLQQPVVLPHFTTIDLLADSLCPLRADDEIASVFRLHRAYQAHAPQPMPIDAFYGWGQQLLTDMSNVDMALLDVDRMMALTGSLNGMDILDLDDDVRSQLECLLHGSPRSGSVREFFTALWQQLPAIYADFHAAELADGVGTRGARTRWVIDHFQSPEVQSALADRHFVFVGFNYLLAAERELMTCIRDLQPDHTLFYWDYDPDFSIPNGIYSFLPPEISRFGNCLPASDSASHPAIEAVCFSSDSGQAQYVHEWLRLHHHAGDSTAIVVADESLLPQVIYSLPPDLQVNITKGYPLRSTRLFAQTLALLDRHADAESASDYIRRIAESLEQIYHQSADLLSDRWLQVLSAESYYQIQLSLRQILLLMGRNPYVAECLSDRRLLSRLIRRRLEGVSVPFHGEPITDIQIIGVLETRLLDFDNVLILNVEEGVVPNTSVDHSFLPFDLRREYRMQTRDEESKIYGYNFFRLLRRAQHVTLAFSEAATEMGRKSMSRFLMQLLTSPDYSVTRRSVLESKNTAVDEITALSGAPDSESEYPKSLSPTALSTYIECPREYYYSYVRRIRPADDESVILSVSTFGSLVHGVLQSAYIQLGTADSVDFGAALAFAYASVNDDYLHHHPDASVGPYVLSDHPVENHAVLAMARRVLEHDREQPSFRNLYLEQSVGMNIDVITPDGMPRQVWLHGVIDRVDCVTESDGSSYLRILDYKTGRFDPKSLVVSSWDDLFRSTDLRYALQTLIYCTLFYKNWESHSQSLGQSHSQSFGERPNVVRPQLCYPRQVSADGSLHIPSGSESESGPESKSTRLTDYASQAAAEFEPRLINLVREIMAATDFPMADPSVCADRSCHCPFHLLCSRRSA